MRELAIINDLHCGVVRSGGTTPKTAWALRQYVLGRLKMLLAGITKTDLLILGDLLDAYSIPYFDLLEVISMLVDWLSKNSGCTLYLVPGNHDLSKTVTTMSSFQFLCRILEANSNRVIVFNKPGRILSQDAYVIPHVINQEQFNIALEGVPDDVETLYVHCNFDNKFAQQADHSLNLSMDQALKLPVKRIVFAHEHQGRTLLKGKVEVIGNQIPTSVADCIGNTEKHFLVVTDKGASRVPVWTAEGSFARIDWHDYLKAPADAEFIRIEGDASAVEANDVVSAVSKLRSTHNAFVITNAVKIEGRSNEIEARSLEAAQSFDVRSAMMNRLNPEQRKVVEELLTEHGEA